MSRGAPAVFIDKDGTLVEDVPYNVSPAHIRFMPGALEALRLLDRIGYRVVVVTNQSGVARGLFDERALLGVERHIAEAARAAGVAPVAFYYCPHHPDGVVSRYAVDCGCRKPAPGMLLDAACTLSIDLGASWMVGDILDDVEAGRRAGCRTVLVGPERALAPVDSPRAPDATAVGLLEAARVVVASDSRAPRGVPHARGR